ncbi:hypothetical protein [Haloplanus aerogenes]|uniref:Uncharacterized protein n=1 Tax=Haloplanus aerogenes TaxID=660522 RepID=A0A3M0CZH0_9EURY|nr:hypothetical protein [Haloplanus aerogenes]RMB13690.1 hypothetical protein ATH50_2130 [Haloplanus aerogenes]
MPWRRSRIVTPLVAGLAAWLCVGVVSRALLGTDIGFLVGLGAGVAAAVGFWAEVRN